MQIRRFGTATLIATTLAVAVQLMSPPPAGASIHEIIAAMCRAGGEEVIPPGQNRDGRSFLAALMATGFIESVDFSGLPEKVVINFDPEIRASKFISIGQDVTIPNGFEEGVDLVLSPGIMPNPNFPAHANCHNLR
jgi:hypothetical protein